MDFLRRMSSKRLRDRIARFTPKTPPPPVQGSKTITTRPTAHPHSDPQS